MSDHEEQAETDGTEFGKTYTVPEGHNWHPWFTPSDEDPEWVNEHRRRTCLDLALTHAHGRFTVPSEIVAAAEAFETYLKGDTK